MCCGSSSAPTRSTTASTESASGFDLWCWPDPHAQWRVQTTERRGRALEVVGYHRFAEGVAVGHAWRHIPRRGSLLLSSYKLADTLISAERREALVAMVACSAQITVRLRADVGVGVGFLEHVSQTDPGAAHARSAVDDFLVDDDAI